MNSFDADEDPRLFDQYRVYPHDDIMTGAPDQAGVTHPALSIDHRRGLAVSATDASISRSLVGEVRSLPASGLRIVGSVHAEVWMAVQRQFDPLS
jgi:hypothetical protein